MQLNKTNKYDMNNDVSIVVISCDKYMDLWMPFFNCFFKYWPDCPYPIYLATNELEYPDPRIKPIKIGLDQDYSSNILRILEQVESQWLILWIEDLIIKSKIDTVKILELINLAQKNNVGYLKLSVDTPLVFPHNKKEIIAPIPKKVKYRSAIGLALYRKDVLLKLLIPGANAWELDKSKKSNFLEDSFYGLTTNLRCNPPIPVINAVIKGKWSYEAIRFFKKEGLNVNISNRSRISLKSHLYIKLYNFRLNIYRILRKYWHD